MAEEKYDKKGGLYYDHTTIYKKKEKTGHTELYKKRDRDDERNALRRAVENLHEQVGLNNKRINDLVNRYHELYDDLSKFKRWVINEKENSRQSTQD